LPRRPARAPADSLGPTYSVAGDGRPHQPHHRRSREADRAAGARQGAVLARRHRPRGEASRLRRHRVASQALMVMLGWFAPDPTPVLEGPRVVLRAPRARDYEAWRALRRSSREFLRPYEPRWTEADLNRQAYGARMWRGREEARKGTDYSFLIFEKTDRGQRLVGGLTISNVR